MPPNVAIELGKSSLLLAVAEKGAAGPRLTHAGRFDLAAEAGPKEIAEAIQAALPGARLAKANLVVAVGADETRLRRLELPPAPANELPGMIGLLAAKELGAAEDDLLDYLPLRADEEANVVLAARLDGAAVRLARGVAEELEASLAGVVLRPCAAAGLIERLAPETASGARLLVSPSRTGADLVALSDGEPVLIRSTRGGPPEAVAADIRRTLPAAGQELGRPPQSITVVGASAGPSPLAPPDGGAVMRVLDIGGAKETEAALRPIEADQRGLLAGVVGAALDAAGSRPPAFDFVNPRRPQAGSGDRRRQVVLAAAAVAALLLGVAVAYGRLAAIDRETADLRAAAQRLDDAAKEFAPYQSQVALIERWAETDVTWLDEYEQLGRRLRPKPLDSEGYSADEDAYLTELLFRPPARGGAGGQIDLRAAARQKSSPGRLEQSLRDEHHSVQPVLVTDRPIGGEYPVEFRTLVRVQRRPPATGDRGGAVP